MYEYLETLIALMSAEDHAVGSIPYATRLSFEDEPIEPNSSLVVSALRAWNERWERADDEFVATLLQRLRQVIDDVPIHDSAHRWATILSGFCQWAQRRCAPTEFSELPPQLLLASRQLYGELGSAHPCRYLLLAALAHLGQAPALQLLCELLVEDPPRNHEAPPIVLSPLFRRNDSQWLPHVFPRLLDAICHTDWASAVLDLANFAARRHAISDHPARARRDELAKLLEAITSQLERAGKSATTAESLELYRRQVVEGSAMAVSLCDALGLMGDPASSSELLHCMELPHRRLAVEAAAALARLGNEAGTSRLIELAAEPSARLRVLAYGEELGIEEQIDEVYRCAVSIAEAELVTYLADPSQFGIPPNRCELLDSRTLYWPGYEEPRNCYLFRFRYLYQLPDGKEAEYENIGIAGPLAHAFKADMCQLNIDDVYAAFAGWQAEHDEIRELRWTDMDRDQLRHADRVLAQLSEDGYEHWQSQSVGLFFGTLVFVGRANRDGQDGVVVVDDRDTMWFPQSGSPRDIGPAEGYCVYKGQRMLAEFNG